MGVDFTYSSAKEVWQKQNLITNCCAIPFVILAGKFADKTSAKILIPGTLVIQIIVMTLYCFVPDP